MNKVEKIKAEIERLKKSLPWGSCASQLSMECNCKNEAYNEVLSYIDSLEEDPVSNDLEEAANSCSSCIYLEEVLSDDDKEVLKERLVNTFKAGAQWQKDQMIDKVCKWLAKHWREYVWLTDNDIIHFGHWEHDFKKSMEE